MIQRVTENTPILASANTAAPGLGGGAQAHQLLGMLNGELGAATFAVSSATTSAITPTARCWTFMSAPPPWMGTGITPPGGSPHPAMVAHLAGQVFSLATGCRERARS